MRSEDKQNIVVKIKARREGMAMYRKCSYRKT